MDNYTFSLLSYEYMNTYAAILMDDVILPLIVTCYNSCGLLFVLLCLTTKLLSPNYL